MGAGKDLMIQASEMAVEEGSDFVTTAILTTVLTESLDEVSMAAPCILRSRTYGRNYFRSDGWINDSATFGNDYGYMGSRRLWKYVKC